MLSLVLSGLLAAAGSVSADMDLAKLTGLSLSSSAAAAGPGCPASCGTNGPLSCHNTTVQTDTCCFNYPGGQLLQTQFWDANPASGPAQNWTIHGLWPDNCDGTYQQYCDESRQYKNITEILESFGQDSLLAYMRKYWTDYHGQEESFWEHEFGKHATCISTFDPSCYTDYVPTEEVVDFFTSTVNLFQKLNTFDFLAAQGILPSATKNYTYNEVKSALFDARGVNATIICEDGALSEVYYTFNIRGSVQHGAFVPVNPTGDPDECPTQGRLISYPPKELNTTYPVSTPVSVAQTASLPTSCRSTFDSAPTPPSYW